MKPKHHFEHNDHTNLAFLLTAAALQALATYVSYIAYETWVAAFGPGWRILELAFVLFSFTFITATLIAVRTGHWLARAYYWLATYWFASIWAFFGSAVMFVLVEQVLPLVGLSIDPFWAGVASFGAAVAFLAYGFWNAQRVQVTRIAPDLPNLPEWWRGRTIVFVADPHLGDLRRVRFARKIVRKAQALSPEAVLIGGDLYDGVKCDAESLIAPFKALVSRFGTYFVTGNHDFYSDRERFMRAIVDSGMKVLDNEIVNLEGLQLAGVDYNDSSWKENFEKALAGISIDPARPSILLKHVPQYLDVAGRKGFSLQLSGHTHKGQFWPLSFITRYLFKGYDYGLKQFGAMKVCTTSGAGTWGPPFRLGTRSEIVAITLSEK